MKKTILGALLLTSALSADGFGVNLGPFSLQFNVDGTYYADDHRDVLDSPICIAISNQKRIDVIVEGKEKINEREMRITTKRIVVEPYAFGVTKEGRPILQGNVISEKLIKEVTVKYGDDKFAGSESWESKADGYFSGWFKSDKSEKIDISKISNLYVIGDSHFDAPKNFKGLQEENVRVICQLPVNK